MIRKILSSFFPPKNERAERERIHGELSVLKLKSDLIEGDRRKSENKSFSAWGRERELKFWISLPDAGCLFPRDGDPLLKSEDGLFLAMLLQRSKGISQILEARDSAAVWCYLPDVSGTSPSLEERGMHIISKLNTSTLRQRFKETFLKFRSSIAAMEFPPHDFLIGGKVIRMSDSSGGEGLWKFGAGLLRPFDEKGDPLIDRLHEVALFDWLPADFSKAPPLKHDEVFCPLDGPVVPIKATERTSRRSWEILCGREWSLYICPKCLGTFERRMTKMN